MFFSLLPDLQFSKQRVNLKFTEKDFVLAKNIFRKIEIDNSLYATDLFAEFLIAEGARPDYISEVIYNDPNYDWVILLTNKITNLYNDWPLTSEEFEKYIFEKYTNPQEIHHYQTIEIKNDFGEIVQPAGIEVYFDPSDETSYELEYIKFYSKNSDGTQSIIFEKVNGFNAVEGVTYYEYEQQLNDKKRVIQILKPLYLKNFVKLFESGVSYITNDDLINNTTKRTSS
jgi:hypothetical protein